MSEVRYSVNGKYFKDFGVYISSSDGLFDALKRKKVNTYDWAEYHGSSPDLSNPKFEQREITLKGFVTGENWELMKSNFDTIISEFQKAGTQRLLVEPFGLKPLPYEVCMIDDVNLNKTFKDGKMVGVFTLKLIEPNPLKKVLYFTGDTLDLSYNSPNETEIFYGNGLKETAKGNVSLSGKTLVNRAVTGYNFNGRNVLLHSNIPGNISKWIAINGGKLQIVSGDAYIETGAANKGIAQTNALFIAALTDYTISFKVKFTNAAGGMVLLVGVENIPNSFVDCSLFPADSNGWRNVKYTKVSNSVTGLSNFIIVGTGGIQNFYIKDIKVERSKTPTEYSPAPEDEKYIVIAGNVDEITNLTTNADVLWERL